MRPPRDRAQREKKSKTEWGWVTLRDLEVGCREASAGEVEIKPPESLKAKNKEPIRKERLTNGQVFINSACKGQGFQESVTQFEWKTQGTDI